MNRANSIPQMATIWLALFLGLAGAQLPAASNPAGDDQALYFRNGDSIKGRLLSIDLTNGVTWTRRGLTRPARFIATNLTEIFLTTRPAADTAGLTNRAVLEFVNGDELVGELISITNDRIAFRSPEAGALTIPKNLVAGIAPRPHDGRVILDELRGDQGWTHGDMSSIQGIPVGRWHYHNASLVSGTASSIARDLNLPDSIRMDFDIYWHNLFSLAIALHTDSLEPISLNARDQEPDFAPFYSLWLSPTATELRVVPKAGAIRRLGSVFLRMTPGTNRAAVSIFASAARKSVALMIDNSVVKEWIDPEGWSAGGKGIRFVHQGYGHVRIANLRVTKWDGKHLTPLNIGGNPTVDVALLDNASARGGRLVSFTNGVFRFRSGDAVLPVSFTNTVRLNFALRGRRNAADDGLVRVFFNGRGRLSGRLKSWDEKRTRLDVPGLGALTLDSRALGRIEFPR